MINSEIQYPPSFELRALAGMVRTVSDIRLFDAAWKQMQKSELARMEEKRREALEIERMMQETL